MAKDYRINIDTIKTGLPIFRISTSTEEEKQLEILQKDTLEKLGELGYGVYIEDDFIVPIPLFFSKEHFPVKLSTPDGEIKTYDTWEEIKAITRTEAFIYEN